MRLPIYIADAFTSGPFTGNPAAVVPLGAWLPDETLQAIAEQNNLAETAFVITHPDENKARALRWFTPAREVNLCGHATLATAFVLHQVLKFKESTQRFNTLSGELVCSYSDGYWQMDFPADKALPANDIHTLAEQVVGRELSSDQVFVGTDDAMIVLASAQDVLDYQPNDAAIRNVPKRGVILTAPREGETDVVSRCFYPEFGVDEDPATGSAHTLIGPYWSARLEKEELICVQASRRGGTLSTIYKKGERIQLRGRARLYLRGEIDV
ncbi:MAG: PhzF family phenazine biosynthesis protein [Saprospiraceae bacterium]